MEGDVRDRLLLVDGAGVEGLGDVFDVQHASGTSFRVREAAPQLRPLLLEIRAGDGEHHDDRGDELQHEGRHVEAEGDGVDEPEDEGAEDHADGAHEDAAAAQDRPADEEGGEGDGDHAGADVDVDGFLGLREEAA